MGPLNVPCPFARPVEVLGNSISALLAAHDVETTLPVEANPLGVVVVTFCRECDCTHVTCFGAGPLEVTDNQILGALCTAIETLNQSEQTTHEHQEKSSTKNVH